MIDEKTRQRIVEQETSAFLDSQFAPLDLSGSPSLQPLPEEDKGLADKHGFSNVDFGHGNPLKKFVESPDGESLERLADETNNPELAKQIAEGKATAVAQEFVSKTPQYVSTPENYSAILAYMSQKYLAQNVEFFEDEEDVPLALLDAGHWNVSELQSAFRYLAQRGVLEMPAGIAKRLSRGEELHVISLCKSNQLEDAISQYLSYSYPAAEEDWSDATDFLSSPETLSTRNAACHFVWFHSRPVRDSDEWRTFQKKWFRHRPIITIADLDAAYAAFQHAYREELRDRLIRGDQPINTPARPQTLDDLPDEEFDQLYHGTMREYARSVKRQPGVLL